MLNVLGVNENRLTKDRRQHCQTIIEVNMDNMERFLFGSIIWGVIVYLIVIRETIWKMIAAFINWEFFVAMFVGWAVVSAISLLIYKMFQQALR